MNDRKTRMLFEAVRSEPAPAPSPGFDAGIMRAIHRDRPACGSDLGSWFGAFGTLLPRMVVASAIVIAACVAGDYYTSPQDSMGLSGELAWFSEQWLFVEEGF